MSGNRPGASNALEVQVPAIVFFAITPAFVAARFWSRLRVSHGLGLDDWTILTSLVFAIAVSALMIASSHFGFGKHIASLTPHNKKIALKLFYVAQAFYKVNINTTKASILILYLRIFVQRPFRIACWVMIAIIASYGIASTLAAIFQCSPIPRAWDKTIPGHCINITQNWYANAGFSIITDLIILLLPMPIIFSLHLPKSQKISLAFIFALGGFVVFTSVMRMTTLDLSSTSPDTTFEIASSMWTIIEANIGIICACLPMCQLPLTIIFPSLFPSRTARGTNTGNSFSHVGSGKNEWTPPTTNSQDVHMAKIDIRSADSGSEEHILGSDSARLANERDVGIRKVTDFSVSFGR